jgi:Bromodomain
MTPAVQSGSSGRFSNPKLKQAMAKFVNLLINSEDAEIFRRPVKKRDAPDYERAVQHPTDLATIQRATKAGQIVSWDELERELRRMLANCCVYNRPGTGAYKTARLVRIH